jgi:signal transduction histidine kinase
MLAGCFLVVGALTTGSSSTADARPRDLGFALLLVAVALPYLARRRAPGSVFVVSLGALAVMWVAGYDTGVLGMSLLAGAYTVAALARPVAQIVSAVAVMGMALALAISDPGFGALGAVTTVCTLGISAALGRGTRERLRLGEQIAAQKIILARSEAELARRDARLAELGATADRQAVAREVHDALAHALSTIAVQAGVTARLSEEDPRLAQVALDEIAMHARGSLSEMRMVISALRKSGGEPVSDLSDAVALGSATNLERILDDNVRTGLAVEVERLDDITVLKPVLRHDVLRVIQEALTNVRRHSLATTVKLAIEVCPRQVTILVEDPGPPRPAPIETPVGGGFGLAGMHDRLALHGGRVSAGATTQGGYRVHAQVPTGESNFDFTELGWGVENDAAELAGSREVRL